MRQKRKILSLMLAFLLVVTLIPTSAFATSGDNAIKFELVQDSTTFSGKNVLRVDFLVKTGEDTPVNQNVYLKYDANKIIPILVNGNDGSSQATNFSADKSEHFTKNNFFYNDSIIDNTSEVRLYTIIKDGYGYINWKVTEPSGTPAFGKFTRVSSIFFRLEGVTFETIPEGTIDFATVANDKTITAQTNSGSVTVNGSTTYAFGIEGGTDTLTTPPVVAAGAGVTLVEPPKPALGGSVSISGTAVIGNSLSVNKSLDYNGAAEGTLGYQWKANGAEVGTDATYTVKADDFGKTITVTVTNSNNSGSVTSVPTAAVVKKDYTGSAAIAATVDKTATTVTVNSPVAGREYAITTGSTEPDSGWNTTGQFTDLSANTTYTVYTRVAATDDTKASASETTSVTTDKLTQTITVPTGTVTVTYGSKLDLKTVCSSNASGSTLTFTLDGTVPTGSTFTAGTGVIDATGATVDGTFKVKVNAAAYGDYNAAAEQEVTISIEQKPAATVTTAPVAKTGLKYTGSAQELITAGTPSGGTMMYKVGSGSYSTDIPKEINANTYTIYYYVKGDENHSNSVEQHFDVKIEKADATVTSAPAAKTDLTYTGSAQELITAGTTSDGTMQYKLGTTGTYGAAIPQGTDADTYQVYYKVLGDANHNDYVAATPISVTIGKADATVTSTPAAKTGLTYTGSAQELITAGATSDGTMQYKLGTSGTYGAAIPQGTDADTYQVYYKVLGDANHNDYVAATPISVTIDKADATVTSTPTAKTGLKYTGSAQELITAGATSDGTMQYKLVTSGTYGAAIPQGTDADTYQVYYKVKGDANHNDYEAATPISVTIGKADASDTMKKAAGSAKYGATENVDLSSKIANGGTLGTVTKTDGQNILAGDPYMDGNNLKFTFKNEAGNVTKTATINVPVNGSTNYEDYTIVVTVTVNAKPAPTISVPTAKAGLVFSGAAQNLISAGSTDGGTMQYKVGESGTYSTAIPQGIDAGTYQVFYRVVGDDEYADVPEDSISATISKKPVTVAPKNFTITKGSAIPTFELAYTGLVNGDALTPNTDPTFTCYETGTTDVSTSTAAGNYTITWTNMGGTTFTGADNYEVNETATGTLTIKNPSSGGGYIPPVQKPTIEAGEGVKVTLSSDGTVATITVDPAYELADVVLNGTSKGKVTEVKGLKTGDKLVVTVAKKATEPTEPTKEEILAALEGQQLVARSKVTTTRSGKKAILITWYDKNGNEVTFDGVEIFRSTKRNSGYGTKPIFTSVTGKYYNTSITEGTRYYYKLRGFVVIDGQKYYTEYSLKAIRTAK